MPQTSYSASAERIKEARSALVTRGLSQNELADSIGNISPTTVNRFFNGKAIIAKNVEKICKALGLVLKEYLLMPEEIADNSPAPKKFASICPIAYDDKWVGREKLTDELSKKIQGGCRILLLAGITGIGKTALAERLVVGLQEEWEFGRVNCDDQGKLLDFCSIASELLDSFEEAVTPDERRDTERLLSRLVKKFRENRYLFLIDSLELILEGNERQGWSNFKDEWWLKFFRNLLTAETCQSCVILTSQDLPPKLKEAGLRYPNYWYSQPLSGLTGDEQLNLFAQTGLNTETESLGKRYLVRIGKAYEGHPLALRVIAGEIKGNPYNGDIEFYWKTLGNEIEKVEKSLEEARNQVKSAGDDWQLHQQTQDLRDNIRSRLEITFNRLKNDVYHAYILLCVASVYSKAVEEKRWLKLLNISNLPEDWDKNKSKKMLETLHDRYLVEKVGDGSNVLLRQHNLIRSLALEHLKRL